MKKLTKWEAACIVAGNGIGGGMMAIPYLFHRAGTVPGLLILLLAWLVSAALHLMIADMLLAGGGGGSILWVFEKFLFRGRWRRLLTALFFAVLAVVLVANLAAYIAGGAEILAALTGMGEGWGRLCFYAAALVVPALGLKALGVSEKAGVNLMLAVVALLCALSFALGRQPLPALPTSPSAPLALFGGIMFGLSALFAVPQAVQGLAGDRAAVKSAVVGGLGLNAALAAVISLAALRASQQVTAVAVIGWSEALGAPVQMAASLFVLLAMLTSFWAISLALKDMVEEQTRLKGVGGFVLVTAPSLLVTYLGGADFLSFVGVTGGAVAVIVATLLLPAYRVSCRKASAPPLLGPAADRPAFALLIGLCYLLMAVGSVLNV